MIRILILAIICCAMTNVTLAGERQRARVTMPDDEQERHAREAWGYADAVLSGDTAYLSGVVALLKDGETTPEAAYQRVFERIEERLQKVGCTWDDVVEMTSYHTDIAAQLPFMQAAKRRFIRPPHLAWTAVGVTRLIPNNGITEIKVIARSCQSAGTADK